MSKTRIHTIRAIDLYHGKWQVVTQYEVQRRWLFFFWMPKHTTPDYQRAVEYQMALDELLHG